MAEVVRPYRGVGARQRQEQRRARLLSACREVVGSAGVEGVTVEAVCAEAGLTKRYFYESFTDRDLLLTAVYDEMAGGLREALVAAAATAPADTAARVEAGAAALTDTLTADRHAARVFAEAARNPALARRQTAAYDEFARVVDHHLLGQDAGRPAGHVAAVLVVAGATEVLGRWLRGDLGLTRDELVPILAKQVLALRRSS
ncbi:TetR family transcriptional regulator [Amycolatopsis sp. PS_44_ISF1]|uniref:TetR family transcriptional regulator n=1 Tax=Amycolatopsis sp. PS_44_ISF1 TaxID=2974917 RepID=UPI0028DD4CD3|nr:TetR family transcriptional regulator [Amycolatopsis sp. PS_44_ISF1]MDT8913000.1 TetR family transcriptional regulator [Amycolatopsis sp. PS_44_ISF1]